MNVVLALNIVFAVAKGYIAWMSESKSIFSALVDAVVDVSTNIVLSAARWYVKDSDKERYPVGVTCLEPTVQVSRHFVTGTRTVYDAP